MTVGDLLELLEGYDADTPVMIAHQPSWPLAETIDRLVDNADRELDDEDDDDEGDNTVWLVAGGHPYGRSPYAPRWVFSE